MDKLSLNKHCTKESGIYKKNYYKGVNTIDEAFTDDKMYTLIQNLHRYITFTLQISVYFFEQMLQNWGSPKFGMKIERNINEYNQI